MATATRERKSVFAKRLARAGYDDFLILEKSDAESILTEKRRELLDVIAAEEVESISALAERVGRDMSAVHRDLGHLFTYSLIEYEEEGGRKIPRLKHEHVFVEPLV